MVNCVSLKLTTHFRQEWSISPIGLREISSLRAAKWREDVTLSWLASHEFSCVDHQYTIDHVIFACLNFHEFLILEFFTKIRIREFSFFLISAIVIIIFARFLNSRIGRPLEIREN